MKNKYHKIKWNDEKVSFFWDFEVNYKNNEEEWFTNQVGSGILNFVNRKVKLQNLKVLDYGSGKGFLVEKLLNNYNSINVSTCEFSKQAFDVLQDKFSKVKNYNGTVLVDQIPCLSMSDNAFDVVFLTEVIEHLTETYFNSTFQEINRVLKPGGYIVVTTPNDENLDRNTVCCPDCGVIFHKMQHLTSFTTTSISKELEKFNFDSFYVNAINFSDYNSTGLLGLVRRVFTTLKNRKKPHLIYIGKKKV
jgi:ubiquinone/menaquinone biosynthesis C-methylase UbiE